MNEISDEVKTLEEDAGELIDSAASTARKRYREARKGVSAVMEHGRDIYGIARKRALKDTRAADVVLHENLYQTVLIGIGVGVLLGYLVARHGNCNSD